MLARGSGMAPNRGVLCLQSPSVLVHPAEPCDHWRTLRMKQVKTVLLDGVTWSICADLSQPVCLSAFPGPSGNRLP